MPHHAPAHHLPPVAHLSSDGRYIKRICPQVVEFDPLNATIHQVNERVAVADISPLAQVYRRTLVQLLATP
jgi:succinyl-diaminopimelate desuccinylase